MYVPTAMLQYYRKLGSLKKTCIYFLTVSLGQGSHVQLSCIFYKATAKVPARAIVQPEIHPERIHVLPHMAFVSIQCRAGCWN